MKKKIAYHKCALCQSAIANKTNSHIIPSFIICKIASSDRSGRRNHELVYSIGKTIQAYAGNEVPIEEMEQNFDDLSDERINKELKVNPLSKDYIFCTSCEKALGDYLESPYASQKNINAETTYFFWLSILWRVGCFETFNNRIPKFILTELRKSLNAYLQARKRGVNTNCVHQKYPFNYHIISCKDYSIDGNGFIYAEYDTFNRVFSITLGDIIICYNLKNGALPDNYSFLGIEEDIKQAPSNDVRKSEGVKVVSKVVFTKAYDNLIEKVHMQYVNDKIVEIRRIWAELKQQHIVMPSPFPSDFFIKRCLEIMNDDKKKIGEKYTIKNFITSFVKAFREIYYDNL